jgi:hypothetical protein
LNVSGVLVPRSAIPVLNARTPSSASLPKSNPIRGTCFGNWARAASGHAAAAPDDEIATPHGLASMGRPRENAAVQHGKINRRMAEIDQNR